jgi:hypothetical protein
LLVYIALGLISDYEHGNIVFGWFMFIAVIGFNIGACETNMQQLFQLMKNNHAII